MWETVDANSINWVSDDIGSEPIVLTWTILPSAAMKTLCLDGFILPILASTIARDGLVPVETDIGTRTIDKDIWNTVSANTMLWEVG
jgi:hypothetical protein